MHYRDDIKHNIFQVSKKASNKIKLYEKKLDLQQRIEAFNEQSQHLLNLPLNADSVLDASENQDDEKEEDFEEGEEEEEEKEVEEKRKNLEEEEEEIEEDYEAQGKLVLIFPSNIRNYSGDSSIIEVAKAMELDIRKGQANDALEGLRDSLGYKSMLMIERVRTVFIYLFYTANF